MLYICMQESFCSFFCKRISKLFVMIDLSGHISTLLTKEELVILPHMGGFLLHSHGANIYHSEHTIQAPGSHVVFNAALNNNDGVLAHYIAEQEGIHYKKALEALEIFAQLCKEHMQKGHSILFERMGILSYNAAQKLHFEPFTRENHSATHFALPSISLMPIVRQEPTIVKLDKEVPNDIKWNKYRLRSAAAVILVVLGVGVYQWLPLQNTQKANISLLPGTTIRSNNFTAKRPTRDVYHIEYFCDDAMVTSTANNNTTTSETIENEPLGRFHIISGVFKTEERANIWMTQLAAKGFKPYLLYNDKSSKYKVSAANYTNKKEALTQLRHWQTQDLSSDWWFYAEPKEVR